jgi:hypothetical protein
MTKHEDGKNICVYGASLHHLSLWVIDASLQISTKTLLQSLLRRSEGRPK